MTTKLLESKDVRGISIIFNPMSNALDLRITGFSLFEAQKALLLSLTDVIHQIQNLVKKGVYINEKKDEIPG